MHEDNAAAPGFQHLPHYIFIVKARGGEPPAAYHLTEQQAVLPASPKNADRDSDQISFADMQADEIRETLRKTDLNTLTPIEAMNLLFTLQRKATQ